MKENYFRNKYDMKEVVLYYFNMVIFSISLNENILKCEITLL